MPSLFCKASSPPRKKENFLIIIFSSLFALAHVQVPLFSSNQNTYLLHAVKNESSYRLSGDWFSSTVDPFPIFTVSSRLAIHVGGEAILHLLYTLLLFFFFWSLFTISIEIFSAGSAQVPRRKIILLTSIWLLLLYCMPYFMVVASRFHSFAARVSDVGYLLTSGLAGQYVTGSIYQPSVFGVLLVTSLALWMTKKQLGAFALLGIAPLFHASYILPSTAIAIGYIAQGKIDYNLKRLSLPILIYVCALFVFFVINYNRIFSDAQPSITLAAKDILFDFRIPHHANPLKWFGMGSLLQYVVMLFGLYITRKTNLFLPFSFLLTLCFLGPIAQVATGSKSLALLFPWRASVIAVPISSTLLGVHVLNTATPYSMTSPKLVKHVSIALFSLLLIFGITNISGYLYTGKPPASRLAFAMKEVFEEGDVFLVQPSLEDIRLRSKVPIYVDFKSHPYRPNELIEWRKRVENARSFYNAVPGDVCAIAESALSGKATWIGSGITAIIDIDEEGKADNRLARCKNIERRATSNGYTFYARKS